MSSGSPSEKFGRLDWLKTRAKSQSRLLVSWAHFRLRQSTSLPQPRVMVRWDRWTEFHLVKCEIVRQQSLPMLSFEYARHGAHQRHYRSSLIPEALGQYGFRTAARSESGRRSQLSRLRLVESIATPRFRFWKR